jgi:hypothetical protein
VALGTPLFLKQGSSHLCLISPAMVMLMGFLGGSIVSYNTENNGSYQENCCYSKRCPVQGRFSHD